MRRQFAALLVGAVMFPQLVAGQAIAPGTRVRFSHPGEGSRTGTVVALTTDTLEVRLEDRVASAHLPLVEVTRLEVSRGKQRHPRYAGVGALVGVTVGAVGGFASGEDDCTHKWVCISRPAGALLGGAFLGSVGGVIGLLAGVIPSEEWERVSLEQRRVSLVTPSGSHGQRVGLRFAF
jgi:hypothetical protein